MKRLFNIVIYLSIICLLPACTKRHQIGRTPDEINYNDPSQRTTVFENTLQSIISASSQGRMDILIGSGTEVGYEITRTAVSGQDVNIDIDFIANKKWGYSRFFNSGRYNLARDKGGAAFIHFVIYTLKEIVDVLQEDARLKFKVSYHGGADGLKVKKTLRYRGEFGDILIPYATLNEETKYNITYKKGQFINNADLALLRAYSAQYLFEKHAEKMGGLDSIFEPSKIIATTYDEIGKQHRFVRVSLSIVAK